MPKANGASRAKPAQASPIPASLDAHVQQLEKILAAIRSLYDTEVDYIVSGNHESSPAVRRERARLVQHVLTLPKNEYPNEAARNAKVEELAATDGAYQLAMISQQRVASELRRLSDEAEVARLRVKIGIAVLNHEAAILC